MISHTQTVYVVIGGWEYEGYDINSTKVFGDVNQAEDYANNLKVRQLYDFSKVMKHTYEIPYTK